MNFVLAAWHEPEPISRERAHEVYAALARGESGGPHPHPGVAAFAARLPEAEALSPAHALVTVDLDSSDEVARTAFALARECGLVCYDPQRDLVHNLAPTGAYREMQLHTGDGMIIEDPDLGLVVDVLDTLSPGNSFAALVVFGRHFVQVSPEPGGYELEYKDSAENLLLRSHAAGIEDVREAFAEYAAGDRSFLARHDWQRV
ncbi:hypothetical protein Sme01_67930 [Sphaerisporangium melleum]|uniref:Uncharacterized protein n=1 Tax=Sphaerisporangium melleum TaxID=321316 RepID=A0A917RIV8_9ACTN|nr:hypothetical protein [Sphaerisporangium melleum]GGL08179.1 hypothetical protein GCM10007964_58020 [Sphaerisporangium melleum]GII74317.1 hypothetical protein Sme01_67930 [Sphaerisporangium melleum]